MKITVEKYFSTLKELQDEMSEALGNWVTP